MFVNDVCSGQWGSCCCLPTSPSRLTLVAINVNYAQTRKKVHDRPRRNPGASVGCCHPEGSGIKIGRELARAGSARWIARWAQPPQPMDTEPAALTLRDVRASDYGFVDNGLSVQPDGLHSRHLTDRAILKQTLLTGKPKVSRKEACDKMRSSRQAGRKALPKEKWTAVMAAAAGQHPNLLRLEGETLCLHAQVIPDTSDGKVRYHNDLMKACGLHLAGADRSHEQDN